MIWSLAFRYLKKKTIWIASATPRNRDIKLEVQQALPDIVQADDVMRGRWADLERWWADCRQVWSSRCQGSRSEQSEWQDRNHNWSAEAFFSAMLTLRRSTTWRQKGSEKEKKLLFSPLQNNHDSSIFCGWSGKQYCTSQWLSVSNTSSMMLSSGMCLGCILIGCSSCREPNLMVTLHIFHFISHQTVLSTHRVKYIIITEEFTLHTV